MSEADFILQIPLQLHASPHNLTIILTLIDFDPNNLLSANPATIPYPPHPDGLDGFPVGFSFPILDFLALRSPSDCSINNKFARLFYSTLTRTYLWTSFPRLRIYSGKS